VLPLLGSLSSLSKEPQWNQMALALALHLHAKALKILFASFQNLVKKINVEEKYLQI